MPKVPAIPILPRKQKRNLVISPVGDKSCHRQWLKPGKKNFDLMLIYYGDKKNKYKDDGDYYLHIRGLFKLESIIAAINRFYNVVKKYDSVFLPDHDIAMNAAIINRFFRIFHKYDLDLAQPSLKGGVINHSITRQDKSCILRYTNFVEIMCPIFKTDILLEVLYTFTLNRSGYGIELLWGKLLKDRNRKIAIIDSIDVYHKLDTQLPFYKGEYYKKLVSMGIDPLDELAKIENRYGVNLNNQIVYKRVKKH